MFNKSEIQNVLGTLYTTGSVVFHPSESKIYTPLANRVKCIDLKNNVTSVLSIEANRALKLITINPHGSIMVVCDVKNNLIIYNLLADFVIGRLGMKGNVTAI
jgi:periodic tryptophan protein 2